MCGRILAVTFGLRVRERFSAKLRAWMCGCVEGRLLVQTWWRAVVAERSLGTVRLVARPMSLARHASVVFCW